MKKTILILATLTISTIISNGQSTTQALKQVASDEPAAIAIASERTEVPMQVISRKPVVEAKIDGKGPFKFFLDTGAGATVLDQSLATELSLEQTGTTTIGDPADPHGITADQNRIKTLEIGSAVFSDLIAVSWDRSGLYKEGAPRGVLGMPLFRKLLLTIDYPGSRIVIERGTLQKGPDVIEYQLGEAGLFAVPLKIGSTEMTATLDTGASGGLSFPPSYIDKLSLEDKPKEIGRGRTVGGESIIYGAKLKDTVRFGGNAFESLNVAFFDRLTHLNIGYGLLNQFAITIDQQNKRIRFVKASTPIPTAPVERSPESRSLSEFAGTYGVRKITVDNGGLYLQRLSGPKGAGPLIKLTEVSKDTFSVEGIPGPRVKFARTSEGKVVELQVLGPDGNWESAKREN